ETNILQVWGRIVSCWPICNRPACAEYRLPKERFEKSASRMQSCPTLTHWRASMNDSMQRRGFLTRSMGIAAALSARPKPALAIGEVKRRRGAKIKIALNAYSFNRLLTAGNMTLDDVIDYCAEHDIDGVDTTGYYFTGYPKIPNDEYIYNLKKKAYLNG